MKTYSVPLKVYIYYHSFGGTSINFTLANGKASYSMELDVDYGTKENKILATLKGKEYLFSPDIPVKCSGKNLKSIWKFWNENGKETFYKWFVKKENVL